MASVSSFSADAPEFRPAEDTHPVVRKSILGAEIEDIMIGLLSDSDGKVRCETIRELWKYIEDATFEELKEYKEKLLRKPTDEEVAEMAELDAEMAEIDAEMTKMGLVSDYESEDCGSAHGPARGEGSARGGGSARGRWSRGGRGRGRGRGRGHTHL